MTVCDIVFNVFMLGSYSCIHTTIERLNKLEFFSDRNGLKNGQHGETAKAPRLVQ